MENTTALLLTQYERFGSVGRDEYIENFINEDLDIDISMLSDYNSWLIENHYGDDYIYTDLEEMLQGYSIIDIVKKVKFGNMSLLDDYYVFDGYGNIKSFSDTEIIRKMQENRDFLEWYIEENELIEWDEAQKYIDEANELIKKGY